MDSFVSSAPYDVHTFIFHWFENISGDGLSASHSFLQQVAFDGIGSMPMARIENYRQVKQEAVDYEMKRRNARKNLDHALIASPQDSKVMQVEGEARHRICACISCILINAGKLKCPNASSKDHHHFHLHVLANPVEACNHCNTGLHMCRYQWRG